jgi:LAS superfamily LD-carboxypeptidase LdcB
MPQPSRLGFAGAALRWLVVLLLGLAALGALLRFGLRAQARPPAESTAAVVASPGLPPQPLPTATLPASAASPLPASPSAPPATPAGAAPAATTPPECAYNAVVSPDLLTYVSRDVGLGESYVPSDLKEVPLDSRNLAFRPVLLREKVHKPLLDMLDAMNQAGLSVWAMSGYRSYSDQQVAYDNWQQSYPGRAGDFSALPGHSEHQLGTAVDFSTPYMADRFGDFFHVSFSQTPEGQWLLRQAPYYGFTASYPAWAVGATSRASGYEWEPWHFRYVGALAEDLDARHVTVNQYLEACAPP